MTVKFLTLCLALTMAAGIATTSLAAETVEINGYEMFKSDPQISISNVIREIDNKYVGMFDRTYICQIPVTVTALDDLAIFGVSAFKMMDHIYIEGEHLKVEGEIEFADGTVKQYEPEDVMLDESYTFKKGATVTITEPGLYVVGGRYEAMDGGVIVVLDVRTGDADINTPEQTQTSSTITATPTSSTVFVNGTAVDFEAYTINGNNYFKLRDIAKVVSGSEKQFEVTWDSSKNAINLISAQAYTEVGGELAAGDGTAKDAVANNSTIYKDGVEISLTAYTINGNNYFKLRDLGQAFSFGVIWDEEKNAVVIDTTQEYSE